jgi:hypothetical protein
LKKISGRDFLLSAKTLTEKKFKTKRLTQEKHETKT